MNKITDFATYQHPEPTAQPLPQQPLQGIEENDRQFIRQCGGRVKKFYNSKTTKTSTEIATIQPLDNLNSFTNTDNIKMETEVSPPAEEGHVTIYIVTTETLTDLFYGLEITTNGHHDGCIQCLKHIKIPTYEEDSSYPLFGTYDADSTWLAKTFIILLEVLVELYGILASTPTMRWPKVIKIISNLEMEGTMAQN